MDEGKKRQEVEEALKKESAKIEDNLMSGNKIAAPVPNPNMDMAKTLKAVGNVLDGVLLASFGYYIFTDKKPPRGILLAGAVGILVRFAKNTGLVKKETIEAAGL